VVIVSAPPLPCCPFFSDYGEMTSPQFFHAVVVLCALFAAGTYCLLRTTWPSVLTLAAVATTWLFLNGPLEGNVLVVITRSHGLTESDMLSLVGLTIAVMGATRLSRQRHRPRRGTHKYLIV
jgi:hypothetical protein